MPETELPGRRAAGLVTSLAPTTSTTSVRPNSGLISSMSFICWYGRVRLGEQHVHVPGHPPGDRVDAEVHVDAVVDQRLRQLDDLVLRLRRGQTVAGHDDHPRRVRQLQRRVVDGDLPDGAAGRHRRRRAALSPVPNPPAMMLTSERFIASAISLVRMPPAAPTSAPAMISGVLSMTKPAIATAVPVQALSREMTTGMSAPPIGSVASTPRASAATESTTSIGTPPQPAM